MTGLDVVIPAQSKISEGKAGIYEGKPSWMPHQTRYDKESGGRGELIFARLDYRVYPRYGSRKPDLRIGIAVGG